MIAFIFTFVLIVIGAFSAVGIIAGFNRLFKYNDESDNAITAGGIIICFLIFCFIINLLI